VNPAAGLAAALRAMADPAKAQVLAGFFKTGPGQYGEGDRFLGVSLPQIRGLLPPGRGLGLRQLDPLLASPWHEERVLGALLLADRARRCQQARDLPGLRACARHYLARRAGINNWDLVDLSAPAVVGAWLYEEPSERRRLKALAAAPRLWDRRVAMLATFHFIQRGDPGPTLSLCRLLLDDPQDLMHKASGWMLREAGKRCGLAPLREFLAAHGRAMPRTMLRYAIERLPAAERKAWLENTR
jgi:3-methyladenine DNA glycosylase AlkD